MNVRPLRADEIDQLIDDLWLPFAREMADLDPYNELAENVRADARSYRQAKLEDESTATFVATVDDALAGYVRVTAEKAPPVFARGPEATIGEVYVAPSHRGASLATALLDRAESWAEDRGCEFATLSVNERNKTAQSVYESRDYSIRRYKMDKRLDSRED